MAFINPFRPSAPAKQALRAEAISPSRRRLLAMGCACCVLPLAGGVSPAVAESTEVQTHLAAAKAAAGDDLLTFLTLSEVVAPIPGKKQPSIAALMAMPAPPPGKVFDNLYFVGSKWVSAWAITTSDGIILIDAMDNDEEAERIIAGGMRKLGLDPAQIKIVVVTHGHGDHYGGVGYLKRIASPRVVMSDADWTMMETKLEFDIPEWGRPPARDISVADGGTVRLGDTTLDVIITAGHTRGTISLLFNVRDGAKTHRVLLWGGTAFNFGKQPDRVARIGTYVDAAARTRDLVKQQKVDVFISNHTAFDQAVTKLEKMSAGAANPFVMGTDTVMRALTVMHECALATQVAWKAG